MGAANGWVASVICTLDQIVTVLERPTSANPCCGAEVAGGARIVIVARFAWYDLVEAFAVKLAAILGADIQVVALQVALAASWQRCISSVPEGI